MTAARPLEGARICRIGHHDPDYARNRVLAKALTRAGAEVIDVSERDRFRTRTARMVRRVRPLDFDLLLVGFPGHSDMPAAKLLAQAKRVPVVLDMFVSLWDTAVMDRGAVEKGSFQARRYRMLDRLACSLADLVLLDTDTHIRYLVEELGLPSQKLRKVWAGADDNVMTPRQSSRRGEEFSAFFYGHFIPLHGIEHIIKAAHAIERSGERIRFQLVGDGQTQRQMRRYATSLGVSNVEFTGSVPHMQLSALMSESDVCLGIFGTSTKAQSVIPNKVFDALACARPVLTADTPAARECLTHGQDAWLCPAGDGEAIAAALLALKADPSARERIARAGHQLFQERLSIEALSWMVAEAIRPLLR